MYIYCGKIIFKVSKFRSSRISISKFQIFECRNLRIKLALIFTIRPTKLILFYCSKFRKNICLTSIPRFGTCTLHMHYVREDIVHLFNMYKELNFEITHASYNYINISVTLFDCVFDPVLNYKVENEAKTTT